MTTDTAFWDDIAEKYAAKPVDNPDAFERKIAITRRLLTPDSTVLDVGCGTGSLALILAPHVARVHGLDVSPEMMRIARGKAEEQGADNVSFHVGTLPTATFEPESLDVVMAWSLLHLVPDRAATLKTLYDLCKPGGSLVTSTTCLGVSWVPYSVILLVMRWFGKAPPVWIFRPQTLLQEIRDAGFVDVQAHDVGAKAEICFATARKPAPRRATVNTPASVM